MKRLYLAAPWKRRDEARAVRDRLVAAGYVVKARWLDKHGDGEDSATLRREAQNDLEDLYHAEGLVLLNLETSEGKAVETGYAIKAGLPILVVGGPTNIFHYLPEMMHTTVEEIIKNAP